MEKSYRIKTPDGKIIDGVLHGSIRRPLILIVHGLSAHSDEALYYNAAAYFAARGWSAFRFNLYSWRADNRKLHECTLDTHGQDIDTVVAFLRSRGARKIFAVGHSYGFPSILRARERGFSALISWDGSVLPHHHFDRLPRINRPVRGRIIDSGYWLIIGEALVRESRQIDSSALLRTLTAPVKFITVPGRTGNLSGAKKMYDAAAGPKQLQIIAGATHNFAEAGKREKLYASTLSWCRRIFKLTKSD